jgi:hypothetical protein
MHARRYFFKAWESDEPHMGPALHLIARLYDLEKRAKELSLSAEHCASGYRRGSLASSTSVARLSSGPVTTSLQASSTERRVSAAFCEDVKEWPYGFPRGAQ